MYLSEQQKKITQQIWKVQGIDFIPILFIIFVNLCKENIK